MCDSCHFPRVSNDEFSIECLFWYFQSTCRYVCILLYFSGPGMYHRCHFMKNILQYHSYILPISASFLLLRELSSFDILTYIRIALFEQFVLRGTYFKVLLVCLRKKATQGHQFYVPPTRVYSLVLNWWGIVSWSKWCALLFSENQIYFRIFNCTCTVTFFGGRVYSYLYIFIFEFILTLIVVFVVAASSGGVLRGVPA